jgi:photosystem II stability/assembly factor-like uncharacterized protein
MLKRLAALRHSLPITAFILTATIATLPQAANAQRRPANPVPSAVTTSRMKGIWEPVNYNQDLTLRSVYFVTPNIGWAAGQAGTIIKTVDRGAHWTPQLGGDPQGAGGLIYDLRFVDQRHGFAVQTGGVGDPVLLRTVDGQTWRASGTVPQHRGDYIFTSPTVGFTSGRNVISRTRDAGRSWQKVMDCAATINVNGLSRKVDCEIESFSFPTPQVGYGVGSTGGDVKATFIAKTTDGGNTWALWKAIDDESPHQGFVVFSDPSNGFVCLYGGKFFSTSDGGKSWDGVAGVSCTGATGRFADPETGWTLQTQRWNYTMDGGRSWGSRAMSFPGGVNGFSFPRRDRGYVVGDHGMVYRYSIVPVEHTAANSIDAPVVGAFSSPLDNQVQEFVADVDAFSAENGGASTGASGGMGASASAGSASGSNGGSTAGGTSTDTSGSTTSFDAGSGSTGSSGGKAKRGGNNLGKLQALLDVIGSSMPDFLARYRNLNLLFEGARTAAGMPTWLQTVKGGLAAFRSSTDKSSAAAALAQLVNAADSLKNQTSVAFMQTSFTPGPGDSASGFSSTPATTPATTTADSAAAGAKSAIADSLANAAKKGLGGLLKNPFGKKK